MRNTLGLASFEGTCTTQHRSKRITIAPKGTYCSVKRDLLYTQQRFFDQGVIFRSWSQSLHPIHSHDILVVYIYTSIELEA